MLRISWTEKRTNEWIREKVGVKEEQGLLKMVKRRKISKFCHWKRRPESLTLRSIEYEITGVNKKGRRRCQWIDNVEKWTVGGVEAA